MATSNGQLISTTLTDVIVSFLSNPTIRAFYQRPLGTGKAKKLALTAAMRKLLVILNAMLRNATPWRTANPA
jgi:transposase